MLLPQRLIAWMLHIANSSPTHRTSFYALKSKLLTRYGKLTGFDYQQIDKPCWGGSYYGQCRGEKCWKCNGTGVYETKWFELQKWEWCGYKFHLSPKRLSRKPETITITNRVKHCDYGKWQTEAELWLFFLFDIKQWIRAISTSKYHRPGLLPMCRLQWAAMPMRMFFTWRTCWCGKRFPTWGSGRMMCKKCRWPTKQKQDIDIPF